MAVRIPPGVPPGASFVFEIPEGRPPPMGIPVSVGGGGAGQMTVGTTLPPAKKFAECPISYEPLCNAPVGVFVDSRGARVSGHYYSLAAAQEWLASGNGMCPMTRRPVASVMAIPDVRTDPEGWFSAVDVDRNNHLSRSEAIEAIKAQFPVDVAALDAAVSDPQHWLWQQWDSNGSGTLERNELLDKPQGLVASVQTLFAPPAGGPYGGVGGGTPPDISDKLAWFDYWDSPAGGGDSSGALDREEVLRGLLKTLRITSEPSRVQQMRSTLDAIWGIFDTDGSGTIERREFTQADGLADTIAATLAQG